MHQRQRPVIARAPRAIVLLAAAACVASALMPVRPGEAAAHGARITGVFRLPDCAGSVCASGRDPEVAQGSVVGGVLQVHVAASADLGLEWVRLEAQNPGDPRWYCLEFWTVNGATSFAQYRTWDTLHWTDPRKVCNPRDCSHCMENSPHRHGAPTEDQVHLLRVVAREQGQSVSNSDDDTSAAFRVSIQNAPTPPVWVGDPAVTGGGSQRPSVQLQWIPNPETDVLEYRWVRVDPDGKRTAYAVDASHPENQGCRLITTIAIRCDDANFGPTYGGTYRYALIAVRYAFTGPRCLLSAHRCIQSTLSAAKSVTIAAGSSAASPSASGAARAAGAHATAGGAPGSAPHPLAVAPPPAAVGDPLSAVSRNGARAPAVAVAGVLLLLAMAGAGHQAIRRRARAE